MSAENQEEEEAEFVLEHNNLQYVGNRSERVAFCHLIIGFLQMLERFFHLSMSSRDVQHAWEPSMIRHVRQTGYVFKPLSLYLSGFSFNETNISLRIQS